MSRFRLYFLIVLIAVLAFLGLAARRVEALLLVVPLLVYLGAAMALAPARVELRASRRLGVYLANGAEQPDPPPAAPERVVPPRSQVVIGVQVENQGLQVSELVVADGDWRGGANLARGGIAAWEFRFRPRRGRTAFPPLRLQAGDPFGLFSRSFEVPAPVAGCPGDALLTLPDFIPLKRIPVRPPLLRGFAGPVAARRPGSGTDFYGVREYQPGDPLRRLNWRLSSLHERNLFTNQYEGERFADIGLILDARQSRNLLLPGLAEGALFEYSVLAAASLARAFLRDGHRVSLLVYGFSMERVLPGAGHAHLERLLRALAAARPVHNYALDNLNYLPTRMFPPSSQVVFVSPLGEEDFEPLVRFRALGYSVLVVSPDPIAFEGQVFGSSLGGNANSRKKASAGLEENEFLALRLAAIERALLVRRLAHFGIWVVDWSLQRPLAEALHRDLASLRTSPHLLRA